MGGGRRSCESADTRRIRHRRDAARGARCRECGRALVQADAHAIDLVDVRRAAPSPVRLLPQVCGQAPRPSNEACKLAWCGGWRGLWTGTLSVWGGIMAKRRTPGIHGVFAQPNLTLTVGEVILA